jgi:hypothetical protein
MTLLEKAKSYGKSHLKFHIDEEEIELGIAWAKGEITNSQFADALQCRTANTYVKIAHILKAAVQSNRLVESHAQEQQ